MVSIKSLARPRLLRHQKMHSGLLQNVATPRLPLLRLHHDQSQSQSHKLPPLLQHQRLLRHHHLHLHQGHKMTREAKRMKKNPQVATEHKVESLATHQLAIQFVTMTHRL